MRQTFFPWCFNCRSRLTSNSVVTHSLFLTKSKNCVQPHSFLFINSVLLQVIPDIYVKEKKKIPVLNPPFVVDRVYSGGDGHSDAFGGSRHLTGNVQNLHHGWGIAAALPLVWCFLLTGRCPHCHSNPHGVPDSVLYCVSDAGAAGLQYSHTGQSRGDLHHLCQPHLCHRGAWEGEVVKMMRFFLSDVWIFLCILLIKLKKPKKTKQSYS